MLFILNIMAEAFGEGGAGNLSEGWYDVVETVTNDLREFVDGALVVSQWVVVMFDDCETLVQAQGNNGAVDYHPHGDGIFSASGKMAS